MTTATPTAAGTTLYRCRGCDRVQRIEGRARGTYLAWTVLNRDPALGPLGERIIDTGLYCPSCRAAVETTAEQVSTFNL